MGTAAGGAAVPVAVLLVALAVDLWVYADARAREPDGRDVAATLGPVTLSTPLAWLVGCVLLWVVVVPLYLVARNA